MHRTTAVSQIICLEHRFALRDQRKLLHQKIYSRWSHQNVSGTNGYEFNIIFKLQFIPPMGRCWLDEREYSEIPASVFLAFLCS